MVSKRNRASAHAKQGKKVDWGALLKHWDTWSALGGEFKVPKCGTYGCDKKVKVPGNKWKCVKCGAITTIGQELGKA